VTTTEDLEVRALVLARALQGRMVRAANGLYEAATEAAELCEHRVRDRPTADDVTEWQDRAKYWRLSAEHALSVVSDWESRTPDLH
jgi:hypothetical protein